MPDPSMPFDTQAVYKEDRPMEHLEKAASTAVYSAIQNASNGTDRSKQAQNHIIGVSNLGHCREYARLLMTETPVSDVRDKSAAFAGTALGDAIENQLVKDNPDWIKQASIVFTLPSGGSIAGHPDIVIPDSVGASVEEVEAGDAEFVQGVWDLKSKDKLAAVRRYGMSMQQKFQLTAYTSGAIDKGLLDPEKPIWCGDIFFDRSGADHEAYTIGFWYDVDVVQEIDEWVNDVKYAVIQGETASKDKPREWCWSWCDFATVCRGGDTDAEGLLEDPEVLASVDLMREAADLKKQAKKLETAAKAALKDVSGSTGEYTVRWVEVEPTEIAAFTRSGYRKLTVNPIRGGAKK